MQNLTIQRAYMIFYNPISVDFGAKVDMPAEFITAHFFGLLYERKSALLLLRLFAEQFQLNY